MPTTSERLATTIIVGCGATALMDVAGEVVRRTTGVPPLDLALVGRWIGHIPQGKLTHESIAQAEPVEHERAIGLVAHYVIGIGFAGLLVAHPGWRAHPTFLPALAVGVATTAAPWLIMQPAFGLGVAASKTPDPPAARRRSLRSHAVYGAGLYTTAKVLRFLRPHGVRTLSSLSAGVPALAAAHPSIAPRTPTRLLMGGPS